MKVSDARLEEIGAWLGGERQQDPAIQPAELAAIVRELKQLRLRVSAKSRSGTASSHTAEH